MEKIKIDETLIMDAQLKATGSTIHKINGLIGNYRNSVFNYNGFIELNRIEDALRIYENILESIDSLERIIGEKL